MVRVTGLGLKIRLGLGLGLRFGFGIGNLIGGAAGAVEHTFLWRHTHSAVRLQDACVKTGHVISRLFGYIVERLDSHKRCVPNI